MSLNREQHYTGQTIEVSTGFGQTIEGEVWYDSSNGKVQVRKKDKNETLIYDGGFVPGQIYSKNNIEETIKNNSELKKIMTQGGVKSTPGFLTDGGVIGREESLISEAIAETFETTDDDKYFVDQGMAAQYPIDALYAKRVQNNSEISLSGQSQDHLVISQYRYKSPRAGDIWGAKRKTSGTLLTKGIGRGSAISKFLGLVRLPMPNNIQDSNNVRWGEDTMNAMEAAMLRAVGNPTDETAGGAAAGLLSLIFGGSFKEGATSAIGAAKFTQLATDAMKKENRSDLGNILTPELIARILSSQGIETSAASILARRDGVIPNSNLELLFSAPMLRQFSFMYKMSPRSREEAKIVNGIIRFFKQGMSARKQTNVAGQIEGGSYFLGTPNVFRLQYRTDGNQAIKGLNRIKTCALTQTSVNYTPEGAFASYEKGQPVSVIMTLGFQELEPIYDTDYTMRGINENTYRTDDDRNEEGYRWKITKDEVGY